MKANGYNDEADNGTGSGAARTAAVETTTRRAETPTGKGEG